MKSNRNFRLEDRVLFEAGAVVEAIVADQAAQDIAAEQAAQSEAAENAETGENLTDSLVPSDPSGLSDLSDLSDANTADFADAPVAAENVSGPSGRFDVSDQSAVSDQDDYRIDFLQSADTISTDRELVIINSSVPDKDTLIAELKPDQEVLVLEDGTGMDEVLEYLNGSDKKYSAIHFITHGKDGQFTVNGEKIDAESVNAADWQAVGGHLTEDGDILIYGCDTAKNESGKLLIDRIAEASGADVAASTDTTGFNGNWALEYRTGLVETVTLTPDYSGRLATEITVHIDGTDDFTELQKAITDVEAGGTVKFTVGADFAKNMDTDGDGTADSYGISITSTLAVSKNITIDGWVDLDGDTVFDEGERIVFDGGNTVTHNADGTITYGTNGKQLIKVSQAGVELTIQNMTMQNAYGGSGAAIQSYGSALTLNNVQFKDNYSTANGGAIYHSQSEATLTIVNSTFENNKAATRGGAVFMESGGQGFLNVTNSTFTGNTAPRAGGAIYLGVIKSSTTNDFTVTFDNADFTGNSVNVSDQYSGGGAVMIKGEISGALTMNIINGSTFDGNKFTGGNIYQGGGALYFYSETATDINLNINGAVFKNNTASNTANTDTSGGGAIYFFANKSGGNVHADIVNSEFTDNTSNKAADPGARLGYGGAIFFRANAPTDGVLNITGTTAFSNNTAGASGGALYINSNNLTVNITNADFSENCAYGAVINNEITVKSDNNMLTGGGAISYWNGAEGGSINISDATFNGNSGSSGGALFIRAFTNTTIKDSVFKNNLAIHGGAMVYAQYGSSLNIQNVLFDSNKAAGTITANDGTLQDTAQDAEINLYGAGGAISLTGGYNHTNNKLHVYVVDSTFVNNAAQMNGGAVAVAEGILFKMANSTVVGNRLLTTKTIDKVNDTTGVASKYDGNFVVGGAGISIGRAYSLDNNNVPGENYQLLNNLFADNFQLNAGVKTYSDIYKASGGSLYMKWNVFNRAYMNSGGTAADNFGSVTTGSNALPTITTDVADSLFAASSYQNGKWVVNSVTDQLKLRDDFSTAASEDLQKIVSKTGLTFLVGMKVNGSNRDLAFSTDNGATWQDMNKNAVGLSEITDIFYTDATGYLRFGGYTAGASQYMPVIAYTSTTNYSDMSTLLAALKQGGEFTFAPADITLTLGSSDSAVALGGDLILHGHETGKTVINGDIFFTNGDLTITDMTYSGSITVSSDNLLFDKVLVTDTALEMDGGTAWLVNSTAYGNTAQWTLTAGAVLNIISSTVHSNAGITSSGTINVLGSIISETTVNGTINARYSVFSAQSYLTLDENNSKNIKWQDIFGSELVWDGLTLKTPDSGTVSRLGAIAAYDLAAGTLFYSTTYKDPSGITPVWYSFADGAETVLADTVTIVGADALGNIRLSDQNNAAAGAYASLQEVRSLVVTTTDDVVNAYDFKISLREAIEYAKDLYRTDSSGDYTITFADTMYKLVDGAYVEAGNTVTVDSKAAGYDSTFVVEAGITLVIDGSRTNGDNVIIDLLDNAAAFYVFEIAGGNLELYHLGLHGTDTTTVSTGDKGALVTVSSSGTFTADDVVFAKINASQASQKGGAVYFGSGISSISNSRFENNKSNQAAAVATKGGKGTLTNVVLTGNSGGSLLNAEGGTITLDNITIMENKFDTGGVLLQTRYGGNMTGTNITITGENGAKLQNAIHSDTSGSTFVFDNLYIDGVTTQKNLIDVNNYGTFRFTNSVITNNTVGGSIVYLSQQNATMVLSLVNCTIVDNTAVNGFYVVGAKIASINNIVYNTLSGSYSLTADSTDSNNGVTYYGAFYEAYAVKPADAAAAKALFTDYDNGDYTLSSTGAAANGGTLVGKIGNVFYYADIANDNVWRLYNGTGTDMTYDAADTATFGLTGGTVLTTDFSGKTRILGNDSFSAGAYALKTITVKFDVNGGAAVSGGSIADILLIQDQEQAITNGFTLTDSVGGTWVLKGFDTEATATDTVDYTASENTVTLTVDQVNALIAADKNVTLYAVWEKVLSADFWQVGATEADKVTYSVYNGDQTVSWTTALPVISAYGDYTVADGWFDASGNAAADGQITLTGGDVYYAQVSYTSTLKFDRNGADSITETELILTATALANATAAPVVKNTFTLPEITRGDGWTVVGWGNAAGAADKVDANAVSGGTITIPASDTTFYAVTSKTFTGHFHYSAADGSAASADVPVTIYNTATSGDITVIEQADLAGWNKLGWTTAAQDAGSDAWQDKLLSTDTVTISADTDFYGVYSRGITLSYDLDGGGTWKDSAGTATTGTQYRHAAYNEAAVLSPVYTADNVNPDNTDAQFVGWSLNNEKVTSVTFTDSAELTVYAVWRTAGLTVTISASGSEVTYGDGSITLTATAMEGGVAQDSGITYTWYRNGQVVTGAHDATLFLENANDTGTYTVYAENDEFYGRSDADGTGITIHQREITIDEGSITASGKAYNGDAAAELDCSQVKFAGTVADDPAAENLSVTATGTFESANVKLENGNVVDQTVTISNFVLNDASGNYKLTTTKMTTLAAITQVAVTVTITGNTSTQTYSGNAHTVSGFSSVIITSDASNLYDLSMLGYDADSKTFANVNSTITKTNVNVDDSGNVIKYTMGLTAGSFTNTDENFAVTLNVTDGSLLINKAKVNVTLKGNSDTLTYNGAEQKVEDFTITSCTGEAAAFYEKSFVDVTAIAKGTNAGTYYMDLSGATNNSKNFDVTFETPANGTLTITALDVTVQVKGNTATGTYSGQEQTVSGYTLDGISSGLYSESDFTFSGASVAGTDAGTYDLLLESGMFTNDNDNFNVTFLITEQGKLQINKLAVTVTITGHNAEYKYDGTNHTVSGYDFESSSDLYLQSYAIPKTGDADVASGTDAGTYEMNLVGNMHNTNGNFDVTFNETNGVLTITKRQVTLTSASDTKPYDATPLTNNIVTVSGDGFAAGEGATYNVTGSQTNMGESDNAFTYTLNDNTKAANYDISVVEGKLTVTEAALTIAITPAAAITYDGQQITTGKGTGNDINLTVSGGIGEGTNDKLADDIVYKYYKVENGTETLLADGTAPKDAGTYRIVATLSAENYKDANASLEFTIGKVTITVKADAQTIKYGDSFDTTKVIYTGWVNGENESVLTAESSITSNYVAGNSTTGAVGTYDLVLEETAAAANYKFDYDTATDELTVEKKQLTLTLTGEQNYDGTKLFATQTFDTGVGTEKITATVTANSANVGVYNEESEYTIGTAVYENGAAEGNYELSYVVTLTVNQHNSSVLTWYTTDNEEVTDSIIPTWIYDGEAHGLTAQLSSLAAGDTFTVTYADGNKNTTVKAGGLSYGVEIDSIVIKNSAGEDVTANYSFTHLAGSMIETFKITPRSVVIVAHSETRDYTGEALTNGGYTIEGDGFIEGEGLASVTVEGSQLFVGTADNAVKGYELAENTKAQNYEITCTNGTLTVNQASIAITVTAASSSKTYDGSELTDNGYSVTGTLGTGDTVTATVTGSITDYTEGGVANVISGIKVMHGDTDVTENYAITGVDGLLTINKLVLTLTGGLTTEKIYDGTTTAANTYALGNVVAGDTVSLTAVFKYDSKDVNTADNMISAEEWVISGTDAHNYELTAFTSVAGTITKRDLYVAANAGNITYGQEANVKDYTITNWADGEAKTDIGSMGIDNDARSGAGFLKADGTKYNFTIGDLAAGDNYTVKFTGAVITVNKLTLEHNVVVVNTKVYDGTTSAAYSGELDQSGILANDTVALDAKLQYAARNVGNGIAVTAGTWQLTGADADNYALAAFGTQTADITVRYITVSGITAADKTYDGNTNASVNTTGAVIDNMVENDDLAVSATGKFTSADAGNNKTVNLVVTLTGADAGNYDFTEESQTAAKASIIALPVAESSGNSMAADQFPTENNLNNTSVSVMVQNEAENRRLDSQYTMPATLNGGKGVAFGTAGSVPAVPAEPAFSGQLAVQAAVSSLHEAIAFDGTENIGDDTPGIPGPLQDHYDESGMVDFVRRTAACFGRNHITFDDFDAEMERLLKF